MAEIKYTEATLTAVAAALQAMAADPAKAVADYGHKPAFVPPRTAGIMLDLSKTTIAAMIKAGVLRSKKFGNARRIEVASIEEVKANGAPGFRLEQVYKHKIAS